MRKLFCILIFFLICKTGFAQVLFLEEFNYTSGDLLTAHSWVQSGSTTTNPLAITSPGLTYTNYASIAGNACTLANTGQDVYQSFSPVSSGSVYISFLVNVQSAGTGDYFIALSPSTAQTSYYARLHIKANGSGYSLGLSKSAELTGGSVYGTTVLNFNTTYLVVVKHAFMTASTTDDIESVYVLSSPNLPSSEPTTPEIGPYTNSRTDPADLGMVTIRQGGGSVSAAALILDGIRIGLSWNDIIPAILAPVVTAATNITANSFTANWNNFTGAIGYWLDVAAVSDFSSYISGYNNKDVGNVTSLNINSLDPNTTYYYRIRSSDGTTTSANSNIINVTTVVAAPNATAATVITATSFTANWNASAGATGYLLDVSTDSAFAVPVSGYNNKEVGNVTSFLVSSLHSGQTLFYRVRASNANGISAHSNTITVTTSGLEAPVAQNPTNISTDSFTANWNSIQTAIGYFLDVSTNPDFSTFVTGYNSKDIGNVTSYTVVSLNPSTIYYYRVYAASSGGISPNSNIVSVTTILTAPVATPATNITQAGFKANWNITSGATNYWLDVSTTNDFSSILNSYNNKPVGNVGSYNVTSLNSNAVYYYRISSSNSFGTSPYSNTITVSTLTVGIQDESSNIPVKYNLYQNYPNPFNPSTIIKYQIPESGFVTIKVYNMLGDEICTLINETKSAGTHTVKFNAGNITSGIYFYKIQAGNYLQIKKMILVK